MTDTPKTPPLPSSVMSRSMQRRLAVQAPEKLAEAVAKHERESCEHPCLPPVEFDEAAAQGLSVAEVRKCWPRGWDLCPACGATIIRYASTAHFVMGDW